MVQWNLDEVLVYKNQRSMYPSLNDVLNYGGMERADEGRLYHFGLESRQTPRFEKRTPTRKVNKITWRTDLSTRMAGIIFQFFFVMIPAQPWYLNQSYLHDPCGDDPIWTSAHIFCSEKWSSYPPTRKVEIELDNGTSTMNDVPIYFRKEHGKILPAKHSDSLVFRGGYPLVFPNIAGWKYPHV